MAGIDLTQIPTEELIRMRAAAGAGPGEPYSVRPLPPTADPNRGLSREAAASAAFEEPSSPMIGLGRGLQQIMDTGTEGFLNLQDQRDPVIQEAIAGFDAGKREDKTAYDAYARESPWAAGFGETLPYLAASGGVIPSFIKGMGLGSVMSDSGTEERARSAVVNGGITAIGNTAGRMAGGFLNPALSRVERETLREGRARGVHPRLSQVTKNPDIERLEDWSARMPLGAGVMDAHETANRQGFNRTAAESMGQQPDSAGQVGPEVFAQAQRDMRAIFNEVDRLPNVRGAPTPMSVPRNPATTQPGPGTAMAPPIVVGPNVATAAAEALRQQTMQLTPDPVLTRIAEEALNAAQQGGRMTGEAYQKLHHELTNASFRAFNGSDPASGRAFAALRDAIDESADTSLRQMGRGDLADQLKTVRQQYANFKTLETGRVAEAGNVSPPRVAQALRTNNPDAFRTGRTDGTPLGFMGRWAELFPGLRAGSQTAERQAVQQVATDPWTLLTLGAPAAGIAKATTSPVVTALPARMGGTAAGHAAEVVAEPAISGSIQGFLRRIMRPQTP